MPYTRPANRKKFDLVVDVMPTPRTARKYDAGGAFLWHNEARSTRGGAIAQLGRWLSESERRRVISVRVQECGDDGTCWVDRAKK